MRVGRQQEGQTSMTLLMSSGWASSRMPPGWIWGICGLAAVRWRGLVWRLAMLMPSTTTEHAAVAPRPGRARRAPCPSVQPWRVRMTCSTLPRLPASLPVSTRTWSPLRISGLLGRADCHGRSGHHSTSGASDTIFM